MRVLQVYWPLKDASGPITKAFKTQVLFRSAGHEIRTAVMSAADKAPELRDGTVRVSARPRELDLAGGDRLSFHPKRIRESIFKMSAFKPDVVLFLHPCPHVSTTKLRTWQLLYSLLPGRKIVWWTDVYWQEFYPWIAEVKGFIDRVICGSNAKLRQVRETFRPDAVLAPLPQIVPDEPPDFKVKRDGTLWASQWRSWKGIRHFWETWHEIPMQVYAVGTGQEYRFNRAVLKHVCENRLEPAFKLDRKGNVHILGTVGFSDVIALYKKCLVAVDWTGQSSKYEGHYNSTTLEPMLYGCVPWLRPTLVTPHTAIPKEAVLLQEGFEPGKVGEVIGEFLKDKAGQVRKRVAAWEFARSYVDPQRTIEAIIGSAP